MCGEFNKSECCSRRTSNRSTRSTLSKSGKTVCCSSTRTLTSTTRRLAIHSTSASRQIALPYPPTFDRLGPPVASFDQSTGGGSMMFGSRRTSQQSHRPSPSMSIDAVNRPHFSQIHVASTSASGALPTFSPTQTRANHAVTFDPRIPTDPMNRPRSWSHSAMALPKTRTLTSGRYEYDDCQCSASMYGSIGQSQTRRSPPSRRLVASSYSMEMHSPLYQGETFVLRDRQYLI